MTMIILLGVGALVFLVRMAHYIGSGQYDMDVRLDDVSK